ncbi:MAG TPA: hypothetical protein VHM70_16645 [Polyangiaceae bacterium]|jgi:hypothetical protein|nr:hypothetical protein [Polyangiaceae bacterium]
MNAQLLIDAIMRQTTVLIAQLATSGGVRAPLSHIANQVFLDLSAELNAQGVSRKVSADMFGMALRAYIRKLNRLSESATERGQSLWQAVLQFVSERPVSSRAEVLQRFDRDEPATIRGILHDLTESGLIFSSGNGDRTVFRALGEDETRHARGREETGTVELLSVLIYREGPFERSELLERSGMTSERLDASLQQLVQDGQVQVDPKGRYRGARFVIPLSGSKGWEAAFLDHYHALVRTLCARLAAGETANPNQSGGATYTFEVWPGHPNEREVQNTIGRIRSELSALRERVETYNTEVGIPRSHDRVVCYAGQYVSPQTGESE